MQTVHVRKNGLDIGTLRFRGVSGDTSSKTRQFHSNPKECVPKTTVRKIADRLSFGLTAGHEDEFEWKI
ncbi:MAG: hypothetical protein WD851_04670 [Pirellulales bacterium]